MKKTLLLATLLFSIASCTYKYTPASSAMIHVTNYKIGDINKLKTGEACAARFLGIGSSDASTSIIDAMRNGNISTIKMVDKKTTIGFLYRKDCTIVHGL
jgi:hypothetical protein